MIRFIVTALFMLMLAGCGGTYVDDKHNFERALGVNRPSDVKVLRSIYWQSAHFTDEHCFYLELRPSEKSDILKTLTSAKHVAPVINFSENSPKSLVIKRPSWFAPKIGSSYERWASTNQFTTFGILHDKTDGTIFVYGQVL